jgi:TatD DNase family protein
MLTDTHAHLFWDSYKSDIDQVIKSAIDAQISKIINVGVDIESSSYAANMQNSQLIFYSSVGIHPHEAIKYISDVSIHQDIGELEKIFHKHKEKVVAVGECGLDYNFEKSRPFLPSNLVDKKIIDLQKKLFKAQIDLAKKLNLPLLIHCRDAWQDIFSPLSGTRGLFHTFSGNQKALKKALQLGYFLSFSCIITYPKNNDLRMIIKDTPLDKILVETDSPFLPPQSLRGQRNEPKNIKHVIETIAQIKKIEIKDVCSIVAKNTHKLFGI